MARVRVFFGARLDKTLANTRAPSAAKKSSLDGACVRTHMPSTQSDLCRNSSGVRVAETSDISTSNPPLSRMIPCTMTLFDAAAASALAAAPATSSSSSRSAPINASATPIFPKSFANSIGATNSYNKSNAAMRRSFVSFLCASTMISPHSLASSCALRRPPFTASNASFTSLLLRSISSALSPPRFSRTFTVLDESFPFAMARVRPSSSSSRLARLVARLAVAAARRNHDHRRSAFTTDSPSDSRSDSSRAISRRWSKSPCSIDH